MFRESFGFPWESKVSEGFKRLPLDEKIKDLRRRIFGDNPDENDPVLREFDMATKLPDEEQKKKQP